eukprot:366190-Chlamydomonas_euryale.AAC.2
MNTWCKVPVCATRCPHTWLPPAPCPLTSPQSLCHTAAARRCCLPTPWPMPRFSPQRGCKRFSSSTMSEAGRWQGSGSRSCRTRRCGQAATGQCGWGALSVANCVPLETLKSHAVRAGSASVLYLGPFLVLLTGLTLDPSLLLSMCLVRV